MGVQELPDGEPNPLQFNTIGAYAKAYMDWAQERKLRELSERIAAVEKTAGDVR